MNTLSDEQLKELEGLYQKATQGEWEYYELTYKGEKTDGMGYVRPEDFDGREIHHTGDSGRSAEENRANGELTAALHNAFPTLLSTIQSLRTELAAAKERIAILQSQVDNADATWAQQKACTDEVRRLLASKGREYIAEKQRADRAEEREQGLREALDKVFWSAVMAEGEAGYLLGDIKQITQDALSSQPPQSPWRPKFKVGDKVLIGIESKVNEIDEIWQPDTSKSPAYHLKGKGYFTEGEMSPAPQPPTKGEESHE